jgi:hypothetical protein
MAGKYANALLALNVFTETGKYAIQRQLMEEEKIKEQNRYDAEIKRADDAIAVEQVRYNNEQKQQHIQNQLLFSEQKENLVREYGLSNVTKVYKKVKGQDAVPIWRVKTDAEGFNVDNTPSMILSGHEKRVELLGQYGQWLAGDDDAATDANIADYQEYFLMGSSFDSRGTLFNNPNLVAKDVFRGGRGNFNDLDLKDFEDTMAFVASLPDDNVPDWAITEFEGVGLLMPGEDYAKVKDRINIRWKALKAGIKDKNSTSGYLSKNDQYDRDLEITQKKLVIAEATLGMDLGLRTAKEELTANQQSVMSYLQSFLKPIGETTDLPQISLTGMDGKEHDIDFGDTDWRKDMKKIGKGSLVTLIDMAQVMAPNDVYKYLAKGMQFDTSGRIINWGPDLPDIINNNAEVGESLKMGIEQYVKYNKLLDQAYNTAHGPNAPLQNEQTAGAFNIALNFLRQGNFFNKLKDPATRAEAEIEIKKQLNGLNTPFKAGSKEDAGAKLEMGKLVKNYIDMFVGLPDSKVSSLESLLKFEEQ